jgi:hypothetical protein
MQAPDFAKALELHVYFDSSATLHGPGKYDGKDKGWVYTGSWVNLKNNNFYKNTLTYTGTAGNQALFVMEGSHFTLSYMQYTNRGLIDVYVDGVKVDTINANGPLQYQTIWNSPDLGNGIHIVRFVHAGGGTYIDIDAIEIFAPADTVPPGAINTLSAVTSNTDAAVDLSWTAVGDDGNTGTASSYLVRYSTSAITDETAWDNATSFVNNLIPKAAGQVESLTVTGLTPGATYYFAVRAQDEEPNLGDLSNSPNAVAKSPPPVSAGKYDDTDSAWRYSTGWTTYTGGGPYNNTMHYTSTLGSYAEFTFIGEQFILTMLRNTNRGLIDVYIDGIKEDTIDPNGPVMWQWQWASAVLSNETHTVRFVHAGGGTYIDIDAIEILGPDLTAPAAITDLGAATGSTSGSVDLTWTAVGDDGNTGTASSYLVRYSTSAISDETAWNNATSFTNSLAPKEAGQAESLTVFGLTPGTTYYFAVRAQDEVPQLGNLSNSPSAMANADLPPGAGVYDDTHSAWTYSAGWTTFVGSGPYLNTMHYTDIPGSYAEFTFSGEQFILTLQRNTNRGLIDVYIDGIKEDTIDANGSLLWQWQWTSAVLSNETHTVRFEFAGGGTYMDIDAIEIIAP